MDFPAESDEYQKFVWRMNPPRLTVDNASCETASLFKVQYAVYSYGILLDVVQILMDLDLRITKAYISSDGGWFMDVLYVTDARGSKVQDQQILTFIEKSIDERHEYPTRQVGIIQPSAASTSPKHTAMELTGRDRPGLMSEISALLTEMGCNVVSAELWTHNMRVASLIRVTDAITRGPISDDEKISKIKESLYSILKGDTDNCSRGARTNFSTSITHTERRLHQMMFADRDYEVNDDDDDEVDDGWHLNENEKITVDDCREKGYSVVNIQCRNRPKLVFDTLCTLIDMQYVVFHATIDSDGERAFQEYYIRHVDGCTLNSEAERRRLIQCLRAAIERRISEGLRLELCTNDRFGLLSEVTRIFREHGLSVTRADVATRGSHAINVFYVTDMAGNRVDLKVIEAVRKEIGQTVLKVSDTSLCSSTPPPSSGQGQARSKFSLGNLFGMPSQVLFNLGLTKSYY